MVQTIAQFGLVVVSTITQCYLLKGIYNFTLVVGQLSVEEIIFQLLCTVFAPCIKVEALLYIGTSSRTVYTYAYVCIVCGFSLFKHCDICGTLPFLAVLCIVCRVAPGLHHISRRLIVYLALNIYAFFIVEKVVGVGNEGYDTHIHLTVVLGIAYKISLCYDIAHIAVAVNSNGTYYGSLVNRRAGRSISVSNICSCRIYILLR